MPNEVINIDTGALAIGTANAAGVRSYKGIPYAAAPIGDLRWCAPQACPAWVGSRPTDRFGHNAMQGVVFGDIDPLVDGVSEDCLYLNVWSGATLGAVEKRAVLFWIHGGGFVVGSGSELRYDGARLAARGIVVVTVNHRLNALGFLAHPDLTKEQGGHSGNYGMLDLVAALQWVRRNIAQFGGDPDAVTIAGELAGSMAVSALMASPLAKGLFARAIGESGGLLSAPAEKLANLHEAEAKGMAFAKNLHAMTLKQLRALPAQAILDAAPGLGYRPTIDGHFLPRSLAHIFAQGQQNDVPLLVGWNKDEGFNFTVSKWGNFPLAHWLEQFFGDRSKEAQSHYPADSKPMEIQSARDLGGDLIINHGTWRWLEAQKATGISDIFQFCFDRAPVTPKDWLGPGENSDAGAFHSCEILYVFDNLDAFPWKISGEDQAVATLCAGYWVNFVKTGNPNGGDLPAWPSYRSGNAPTLRINATCSVEKDLDGARHRFLAEVFSNS